MTTTTSAPVDSESSSPSRGRVIVSGVIGNLFEWYDFIIYGFFAPVIATQFFRPEATSGDLLKVFAVFAVGYFARPIGAIIFGSIGDRLGRKKALLLSLIVMAVPTIGMALLPTWESIGVLSPVLLILLRILQGISIGGEFTEQMPTSPNIPPMIAEDWRARSRSARRCSASFWARSCSP